MTTNVSLVLREHRLKEVFLLLVQHLGVDIRTIRVVANVICRPQIALLLVFVGQAEEVFVSFGNHLFEEEFRACVIVRQRYRCQIQVRHLHIVI